MFREQEQMAILPASKVVYDGVKKGFRRMRGERIKGSVC
jgi:hypothetical protein